MDILEGLNTVLGLKLGLKKKDLQWVNQLHQFLSRLNEVDSQDTLLIYLLSYFLAKVVHFRGNIPIPVRDIYNELRLIPKIFPASITTGDIDKLILMGLRVKALKKLKYIDSTIRYELTFVGVQKIVREHSRLVALVANEPAQLIPIKRYLVHFKRLVDYVMQYFSGFKLTLNRELLNFISDKF
ncbi:hypothetical protein ACFL35_05070 [Candidatus Riflebacteria bacterium]